MDGLECVAHEGSTSISYGAKMLLILRLGIFQQSLVILISYHGCDYYLLTVEIVRLGQMAGAGVLRSMLHVCM